MSLCIKALAVVAASPQGCNQMTDKNFELLDSFYWLLCDPCIYLSLGLTKNLSLSALVGKISSVFCD